ncbi:hypothetical protein ACVW0I_008030 [Bradyrhizobium sp. LM6.11]
MADEVETTSDLSKIAKLNGDFREELRHTTRGNSVPALDQCGASVVLLGWIDSGFCDSHSDLGGEVWLAMGWRVVKT